MKKVLARLLLAALAIGAVLWVAACAPAASKPQPPQIHFGEDMCADCGMIINDARFAAAYTVDQGSGRYQSLIFDDIGDMLHHMQQNAGLQGVNWWVHDYDSQEWIDATSAWFVHSDQVKSPMNHGLAAFATQAAAEKLAAGTSGQVLDWSTLRGVEAMAAPHH